MGWSADNSVSQVLRRQCENEPPLLIRAGVQARGDALANQYPELAEKVRTGEPKPAKAHKVLFVVVHHPAFP
jgi:hypothetical protein